MLKSVLKELRIHPSKYFQHEKIETLEQLSVYHGLSWDTYKYRVCFSDKEEKNIYIKTSKEKKHEIEPERRLKLQQHVSESYKNLQRLHEGFKQLPGYSCIKPIACFPESLTLITQESLGTDVWSIVREKSKFYPSNPELRVLEKYCYACGKWLALFQQITKEPEQPQFEFNSMIERFDLYLSRLVNHRNIPFPEALRKRIINFCQHLALSLPEEDRIVAGIHGDFAPVNILIHHNEVTVLDIEAPKYGLLYWDATYFHSHLRTLLENPIYRPATVVKLQEAFAQGFGRSLDPTKKVIVLCEIHNVIQSLLYLATHRNEVNWYRKIYDSMRYKKYVQWLQKTCLL